MTGDWDLLLVIGAVGAAAGLVSGLLGIAGGIVVTPLLLYVPPLLGADPLSMRTVAGLTIVQGLLASVVGAVSHRRGRFLSPRLAAYMGAAMFVAAFAGGAGSTLVSNRALLALFLVLAVAGGVLILLPREAEEEYPDPAELVFSRPRAVGAAGAVGVLGGMVGQGGSFILIPLMTTFVGVPTRIAVGSNLAVVLFSSLAGFLGKAVTGQIDWLLSIPLVLSVIPAAAVGSLVSRRLPVATLRRALALVIAVAVVRMAVSLLSGDVAGG